MSKITIKIVTEDLEILTNMLTLGCEITYYLVFHNEEDLALIGDNQLSQRNKLLVFKEKFMKPNKE